MTSSNGNIFALINPCAGNPPITADFPSQRPVTLSFDVFFDPGLNKRLSKQSRRRLFVTRNPTGFSDDRFRAPYALQWCHNDRHGVSDHRRLDCLLNHLFRHKSKKTSKLRVTGLCEGNTPVTGGFPSQKASGAEKFPYDNVIAYLRTTKPGCLECEHAYQLCRLFDIQLSKASYILHRGSTLYGWA